MGNANIPAWIEMHTKAQPHVSTDETVEIQCHGTKGELSDKITLEKVWLPDYKYCATDYFEVYPNQLGSFVADSELSHITLWKDDLKPDWFLDIVEIRTKDKCWEFPVYRWIKKNLVYNISLYDTSLPMDEKFPKQRETELKEKKEIYEYKHEGGYVMVKNFPDDEKFSQDYFASLIQRGAKNETYHEVKLRTTDWKRWNSYDEIIDLYGKFFYKQPKAVDNWQTDLHFGSQRLQGINYNLIKLVKEIPKNFPVTDEMLKPMLEKMSIADAFTQQRLFIVDLEILDGVSTLKEYKLCAPIALFFLNKDDQLMPVAIQLFQKPGDDNPIYTPRDPHNLWTLVKMWFNNADSAYHEALTHLGLTHLLMEGSYLPMQRNLSPSHPIFKFLAPHYLYVCNEAVKFLVNPGGGIDKTMSYGGAGMMELVKKALIDRKMSKLYSLPEDIKTRCVDSDVLPFYPYRDDASLIYKTLAKYAQEYVDLYYTSDDILKQDHEIQNWAKEMASPDGANVMDLPGGGQLTRKPDLVDILTRLVFTCSVGYSAANFNQCEKTGFPPNYPMTMRGNPPTDKRERSEMDLLDALPDLDRTLEIMSITDILSKQYWEGLGYFEVDYVRDPKAEPVKRHLRTALKLINMKISGINKEREEPYHLEELIFQMPVVKPYKNKKTFQMPYVFDL